MTIFSLLLAITSVGVAQDEAKKSEPITLEGGKFLLEPPKQWKKEQPKSSIVQYEFSAPADAKPDEPTARITIMTAGGSVEQNIERWKGQFENATKENTRVEKFEAGKQTVHWVDIQGSFKESMGGGPFAPGKVVVRDDYRMLGAILETERGLHFIKITGPQEIVAKLVDDTKKMLKELKTK